MTVANSVKFFSYRPVNTKKPNFVSYWYLLAQLLHLPLKFHLSELSQNEKPFSIRFQNSENPRIFRVTGANQNARKLLFTDLANTKTFDFSNKVLIFKIYLLIS